MSNKISNKERSLKKATAVTENPFRAVNDYQPKSRSHQPMKSEVSDEGLRLCMAFLLITFDNMIHEFKYHERLLELCNTPSYRFVA